MASLRNKKLVLAPNQQYEFPMHGDSLRVVSANVPIYFKTQDGDLDFYLEKGEKAAFEGQDFVALVIYHLDAADQVVIISVGKDADIGSAKVSGSVTIAGGTSDVWVSNTFSNPLNITSGGQSYGASYRSITTLAANTPDTIFTPAANVNGAILHSAQFLDANGTGWSVPSFLAKANAPVSVVDGESILSSDNQVATGTTWAAFGSLKNPLKIPAGKGLYFISNIASTIVSRSALYTLL